MNNHSKKLMKCKINLPSKKLIHFIRRRTRDFFKEQLDQSSAKPNSSVSDILKNYLTPGVTSTTYSPKT